MSHHATGTVVPPRQAVLPAATYVGITVLAFAVPTIFSLFVRVRSDYPDIEHYIAMAEAGPFARIAEPGPVPDPFSSRVLGPLLANLIVATLHVSAKSALALVGYVAYAFIALFTALYFRARNVDIVYACCVALIPFDFVLNYLIMIPDSICIVFSLLFLLAITQQSPGRATRYIAAASWMLAIMSRIDTIAMLVVPAVMGIFRWRQWWFAFLLPACAAAAVFALTKLKISESGNVHGLDSEFYYIFKVLANAVTNLFGVRLYTNTIAWCTAPVQIFDIGFLHLGKITQVGYCSPDLGIVVKTLTWYLVIFGIFPFVAIYELATGKRRPDSYLFLVFAAFYVLAPTFGKTIPRLFLYGYPLLIVIFPSLTSSIAEKWKYPALLASAVLQLYGLYLVIEM